MAENKTNGLLESLREPISRRNFFRTLVVGAGGVTGVSFGVKEFSYYASHFVSVGFFKNSIKLPLEFDWEDSIPYFTREGEQRISASQGEQVNFLARIYAMEDRPVSIEIMRDKHPVYYYVIDHPGPVEGYSFLVKDPFIGEHEYTFSMNTRGGMHIDDSGILDVKLADDTNNIPDELIFMENPLNDRRNYPGFRDMYKNKKTNRIDILT
ncbi:MAG: hypothetical protein AABW91_02035 [Nanoarchaeota archaeon]